MILNRIRDGFAWRYRMFARRRYLRTQFRNGPDLVRSYLEQTPCDLAICRDGTVIRHPAGTAGLAQLILEVWFERVYTGTFFTPQPGDTIIDAGANIGAFSLEVARLQPNCRVLAFEPFPDNFKCLQENLISAGAGCVQPHCAALAGTRGAARMVAVGNRSQDHRVSPAENQSSDQLDGEEAVAVPTYSLANVLEMADADTIALFKCDIEGSEADLFAAAEPAEIKRIRKCAIEWHDHIRPGTLAMLQEKFSQTHELVVIDEGNGRWGMLYATSKYAND